MNFDCTPPIPKKLSRLTLFAAVAVLGSLFVYGDEATAPAQPAVVVTPPYGITFPAKVVRVVDGDTIDVELTRVVRIRLLDCWAPETRTRDAQEKLKGFAAKKYLEEYADNRQVKVFIPAKPGAKVGDSFSFRRALGRVWLNGKTTSLSQTMVAGGHATRTRNGR